MRRETTDLTPDPATDYTTERYYCTDEQYSPVAIIDGTAKVIERVAYDAYGRARHMPGADSDGDGEVELDDLLDVIANWGSFGLADFDRSGTTYSEDQSRVIAEWNQGGLDPGELSFAAEDNIIGFSGYLFNKETRHYHVRFRVYDTGLGRWLERDPAGYADGMNLSEYVAGAPLGALDPYGLCSTEGGGDGDGLPMSSPYGGGLGGTYANGENPKRRGMRVMEEDVRRYLPQINPNWNGRRGILNQPFDLAIWGTFWQDVYDGYLSVSAGFGELISLGFLPDDWEESGQYDPDNPTLDISEEIGFWAGGVLLFQGGGLIAGNRLPVYHYTNATAHAEITGSGRLIASGRLGLLGRGKIYTTWLPPWFVQSIGRFGLGFHRSWQVSHYVRVFGTRPTVIPWFRVFHGRYYPPIPFL